MGVIRVDVDAGDLQRRLQGFAVEMMDLRPLWPKVATLGRRWFAEQFASQGGFGGTPWAPLTAAYAAYKGGGSILVLSGRLKRAATSARAVMGASTLELHVDNPIAKFHEYGTRKMVARPIVPKTIPGGAMSDLERLADNHVNEALTRWGLT